MRLADRHAGGLAAGESDDWRHRALCAGADDPELWYPTGGQHATGPARIAYYRQVQAAKAICHRCPVRVQCLDFALREGIDVGIWGGATENERRKVRYPKPVRVCQQCGVSYTGRGEQFCSHQCHHAAMSARTGPYEPADHRPQCGTRAGARRHRKHGEPVDEACRHAETAYRAQSRQEAPA
jgi:WhiB family redox-sensing transcriptional regulator